MTSTASFVLEGRCRRKKHNPASGVRPLGIIEQKVTSSEELPRVTSLTHAYLNAAVHLVVSETRQPARTALPANLNIAALHSTAR